MQPAIRPGAPVQHVARKHGDRPHWVWPTVYAGSDTHGHWLYAAAGTVGSRPGRTITLSVAALTLLPYDAPWVATFNAWWDDPSVRCAVYVDIGTTSHWPAPDVSSYIDLDLDVLMMRDGEVLLVDRDDLERHTLAYGYPPELVALAETSAADVVAAVATGAEPYATTGFGRLRASQERFGARLSR